MAARGEGRDDAPGCVTGTNDTADALSRYRGRPGKHGKITQKFVSALPTSNPPGHQRATATGRRADPRPSAWATWMNPPAAGVSLPIRLVRDGSGQVRAGGLYPLVFSVKRGCSW